MTPPERDPPTDPRSAPHAATERLAFRAAPASYIALCWPSALLTGLWIAGWVVRGRHELAFLACCLLPAAVLAPWLAAFRLELGGDALTYRAPFRARRSIRYEDVREVSSWQPPASRAPVRERLRLRDGEELEIRWKVFPIEAVRAFRERLARARRPA